MSDSSISEALNLARRSLRVLHQEGIDRFILYTIRYLSWRLQLHRFIRSLPNSIATAVYALTRGVMRRTIWLLNNIYPGKYTDADPYKYILVDPSSIEYTTGEIFSKRRGWVVHGDWDLDDDIYMHRTFASAIEQRFVKGQDWEKTVLAKKYEGQRFNKRCNTIEELYQKIRRNGYKSQQQLLEDDPNAAWSGLNDAMHPLANEVTVDIGRNGELLWNMCGQHRLAIAKILGIDQIPVQVFRRHTQWQTIRNKVRDGEDIPEEFLNHPDLDDLLNKEQNKDQ